MSVKKQKRNGIDGYLIRLSTPNPYYNPNLPEGGENKRYVQKQDWIATTRKTEAKMFELRLKEEWVEELKAPKSVDGELTVPEYFWQWYKTFKEGETAPATVTTYETTHSNLKKYLSDVKMKDLNGSHYQGWINDLANNGMAINTVRHRHEQFQICVRRAMHDGIITKDPTFDLSIKGRPPKDERDKYLDIDEMNKLSAVLKTHLDKDPIALPLFVQLQTGMRLGEVLGIREATIDWINEEIRVHDQWHNKLQKITDTKNRKKREVAVSPALLTLLKKRMKLNRSISLKHGFRPEHKFLFAYSTVFYQNPPKQKTVNDRLKEFCNEAGIRQITSHALRHSHGSRLVLEGVDREYIAERLGDTPETIMKTYLHLINELKEKNDKIVKSL